MQYAMSLAWTIVISLGASIVGGLISGLLVMRKITHDTKRLYARQISEGFKFMSMLLFISATSYLESLEYDVKEFDSYQPDMSEKANQVIVNRIRKEYEREYDRRLLRYDTQKLITQVEDLAKAIIDEPTGFKSFFNKYPLHASYFEALYQVSSAVDLLTFWRDEIPKQINEQQRRICISSVTAYLLDILEALLRASLEIKYYCNVKSWTWRTFIPLIRN